MATEALEPIRAAVARQKTVALSVTTLVREIAAKLVEEKDDPAAIAALAQELNDSVDSIAAVVTENTPAAPPV